MKIHSSSLAPSSANLTPKVSTDKSTQNNEQSVDKDAQNKKITPPSTIEQIKKVLANIDEASQSNIIKPTDSRTSRALSAYNQESNAPQQAQRAQLITGIDAYA